MTMTRAVKLASVAAAAAAILTTTLTTVAAAAPANTAAPTSTATDTAANTTCPTRPQPLPPNAVAGAANEALRAAPGLYTGIDTTGEYVTSSALGTAAGVRGEQIANECGTTVENRSVVVELLFPAMLPSASLSEGTVFVSRIDGRYQVWQVAH